MLIDLYFINLMLFYLKNVLYIEYFKVKKFVLNRGIDMVLCLCFDWKM